MSGRRLEKVNRTIRDVVSDVIQNHMSDPRLQGMTSVTRVETAGDLRSAKVFLSVVGVDEKHGDLNLRAIRHGAGHIQSYLAKKLTTRTCPTLSFHLDDSLKKGYEIMKLIDQVTAERGEDQEDGLDNQEQVTESNNEG